MVDFRVHTGLPWHPKTIDLTLEAIGLWTYAGCWCARYQTDGLIPARILEGFAGRRTQRLLQQLTDAHLLAPLNGGYVFVDWAQYQLTREEITRTATLNRSRQAKFRARKLEANPDLAATSLEANPDFTATSLEANPDFTATSREANPDV